MGSIPTRSSSPTLVSPGRISVCGDRPATSSGASMTPPSITTMRRIGMAGAHPWAQVHRGDDAVPTDSADEDPAQGECGERHEAAHPGQPVTLPGLGDV